MNQQGLPYEFNDLRNDRFKLTLVSRVSRDLAALHTRVDPFDLGRVSTAASALSGLYR